MVYLKADTVSRSYRLPEKFDCTGRKASVLDAGCFDNRPVLGATGLVIYVGSDVIWSTDMYKQRECVEAIESFCICPCLKRSLGLIFVQLFKASSKLLICYSNQFFRTPPSWPYFTSKSSEIDEGI